MDLKGESGCAQVMFAVGGAVKASPLIPGDPETKDEALATWRLATR